MKFRFHRESLTESLETQMEVHSLDDVRLMELERWAQIGADTVSLELGLTCTHYGYDQRTDWDTWIIKSSWSDSSSPFFMGIHVVGFSNGKLE